MGDDTGWRGLDPEEACEDVRRLLQEPHERVARDVDRFDRERYPQRRLLLLVERDRLRHELTERHVQVGDDAEGENERDRRREERVIDPVLDDGLADGAEQDGEGRDAELDGADEANGAVHDPERDPRPQHAAVGELAEARTAGGHERVLGRDEERVPQNDQENREYPENESHAPSSGAPVLGGISSSTIDQAAV